jgi:excisionase family DNA binding protein
MPKREYYTPQEVAEMLKVTVGTVRNWYRSGELTVMRAGRAIRIKPSDLNKFLKIRGKSSDKAEE